MRYSLAWLAAKGLPLEALLDRLGLERTNASPDYT
jgi:hypothetical protein